jgi:hypothetical protein
MDEQALSYAEIKALCAGNPLIAEKMGLDVEVAKLKMLKANHQSTIYRLEDNLRLNFPKQIETTKAAIEGYKSDIERLEVNTVKVIEGISPMKIGENSFSERKDAGAALIEACRSIQGVASGKIGTYRGFEMSITFDTFNKEYKCNLKGAMTYTVPLGSDPAGNITRIDNALEKINVTLESSQARLDTLYSQVENAKIELAKPFPQEAELTAKSARLAELDGLLSLDGKDEPTADTPAADAPVADVEIDTDGAPEKVLAVKEGNKELTGDETTPQVPQAPQTQFPKPIQPIPPPVTGVTEKAEATEPPQDKPKKKSPTDTNMG